MSRSVGRWAPALFAVEGSQPDLLEQAGQRSRLEVHDHVDVTGGPAIDSGTSYAMISAGMLVLFGVGGMLLGIALITIAAGGTAAPTWIRSFTGLTGLAALFSWAFLLATRWSPNQWLPGPFYVVVLWGLVIGVWLLVSSPRSDAPMATDR